MFTFFPAKSQCHELYPLPGTEQTCKVQGLDNVCVIKCEGEGRFATNTDQSVMTTHCGHGTQYKWDHEVKNITLPSCSSEYNYYPSRKVHLFQSNKMITLSFRKKSINQALFSSESIITFPFSKQGPAFVFKWTKALPFVLVNLSSCSSEQTTIIPSGKDLPSFSNEESY